MFFYGEYIKNRPSRSFFNFSKPANFALHQQSSFANKRKFSPNKGSTKPTSPSISLHPPSPILFINIFFLTENVESFTPGEREKKTRFC